MALTIAVQGVKQVDRLWMEAYLRKRMAVPYELHWDTDKTGEVDVIVYHTQDCDACTYRRADLRYGVRLNAEYGMIMRTCDLVHAEKPIDDMGRVMSQGLLDANTQLKPFRLQLMDAVIHCLEKSQVSFWVSDGTALGAYREQGMIGHDCDVDLSVREEDVYKISERWLPDYVTVRYVPGQVAIKDAAHRCNEQRDKYKKLVFVHKDAPEFEYKDALQESGAELDLYTFRPTASGSAWTKNDHRYAQSWSNEVMFPLGDCQFEQRTLPCPRDLETYLKGLYGYIGRNAVWDESSGRYVSSGTE